jgi:gliding motility-associated-like protein
MNDPTFQFFNASQNATTYYWDFGDGETSTTFSPSHTYSNTPGEYTVTLYATNDGGCADSAMLSVTVKDELIFHVPNAFTPDGDAYNNTFKPVFYSGYDPHNYTLTIYDRWGEVIFESHNTDFGWDGTYHSEMAKEGFYTWTIRFKATGNDRKFLYNGHVTLIR